MKTTTVTLEKHDYLDVRRVFENSRAYIGAESVCFRDNASTLIAMLTAAYDGYHLIVAASDDQVTYEQSKELIQLLNSVLPFSFMRIRSTKAGNHFYLVNNQFEYWALTDHLGYLGMHTSHRFPVLLRFGPEMSDQLTAIELAEVTELFL